MAEKMKKIDIHDFPVLDCAQERNGNPYGPLCQERLLRFGNVTPDLSYIFFEAVICENCCFMRVDQKVKLRSQSAEEVECLRESEPFATYVNF